MYDCISLETADGLNIDQDTLSRTLLEQTVGQQANKGRTANGIAQHFLHVQGAEEEEGGGGGVLGLTCPRRSRPTPRVVFISLTRKVDHHPLLVWSISPSLLCPRYAIVRFFYSEPRRLEEDRGSQQVEIFSGIEEEEEEEEEEEGSCVFPRPPVCLEAAFGLNVLT